MSKYDEFDLDVYNIEVETSDIYFSNTTPASVICDYTISACSCKTYCGSIQCTVSTCQSISACHSYCGGSCRK